MENYTRVTRPQLWTKVWKQSDPPELFGRVGCLERGDYSQRVANVKPVAMNAMPTTRL